MSSYIVKKHHIGSSAVCRILRYIQAHRQTDRHAYYFFYVMILFVVAAIEASNTNFMKQNTEEGFLQATLLYRAAAELELRQITRIQVTFY